MAADSSENRRMREVAGTTGSAAIAAPRRRWLSGMHLACSGGVGQWHGVALEAVLDVRYDGGRHLAIVEQFETHTERLTAIHVVAYALGRLRRESVELTERLLAFPAHVTVPLRYRHRFPTRCLPDP